MEKELIRLYREQLSILNKRVLIVHYSTVQEALEMIGKEYEDCIFVFLEDDMVQIMYWID